jgi:hypothetical protein
VEYPYQRRGGVGRQVQAEFPRLARLEAERGLARREWERLRDARGLVEAAQVEFESNI